MCSIHIIPKISPFLLMIYLHYFLCFLLVGSGVFVSFSKTSIESVLFLILTFCNAAAILFLFNVEFLGLIFIIIYVGAIAVLFLFVIMMLNVKTEDQNIFNFRLPGTSKFMILIKLKLFQTSGFFIIGLLSNTFQEDELYQFHGSYDNIFIFDSLNNIDILGQVLYNYFLVCFLLAGLILLIALIGAVVLTLRFNTSQKKQHVFRQLSRTDNLFSFLK
jgi:NADH-quinone oxidoreductase subunit J